MRLLCCAPEPAPEPAVDLSHFTLQRTVGRGSYARVRKVVHKASGKVYALKAVDKAKCARCAAAANVVQERILLEEIDHRFVVKMAYAFQDDANCYFVLDFMPGGDLRFHRLRRGSLGENSVRFYVAEIASALAYLHQRGICHRDVKPSNILLDAHGHAHLTDFNTAIHYSTTKFHSAIAGTMMYMAPEMLARTGYSWQVDYWSLGVTAYELLFFGRRPFAHACTTAAAVRAAIAHDALRFPPDAPCSADGAAALAALLTRDPAARLGCTAHSRRRGEAQLRAHAWFRGIDWARLARGLVAPPFVPDSTASNFEEHDDPAPLRARINRLSHLSEKGSAQARHLEEHFTVYDVEKMPRRSYYPHNEPLRAEVRLQLDAAA